MSNFAHIKRLMDSTTSVLLCVLIFTLRATISLWPVGGLMTKTASILTLVACVVGLVTNGTALKKISESTQA